MSEAKQKILVVGLFLSDKNRHKIMRTAADQLGELLRKNGMDVLMVSNIVNPIGRLVDTICTVLFSSFQYKIAIVPLYGGYKSFVWAGVTMGLLKLLNKKKILMVHGGSIPEKIKLRPTIYLKLFARADAIVAPSAFVATALQKYEVKCEVIENVIDLKDYVAANKEEYGPRILWMRTLEDIYNPEMAVRVASLLSGRFDDFKMVMAGYDKGSLQMVKQLAQKLGIEARIEFPGYIDIQQKNKLADDLDIYICTNRIDNAPVSVIEMMALGMPVVSVNSGGIPYIIRDEYNGLLVNLDDDKAMADKITSIIVDPQVGMRLAQNGKAFSLQYGEGPVFEKWQALFSRLHFPVYRLKRYNGRNPLKLIHLSRKT